jgi:hypothetical protein
MKKYILILMAFSFILYACKKDDDAEETTVDELVPVQKQWGFVLNYTATWCFYCGQWGAPLVHEFEQAGDVVAISAHASDDPMYNQTLFNCFTSDRATGGGIPSFWVGNVQTTQMSAMTTLLAQEPLAAIAMQSSVDGDSLRIKTKTKFYIASEGHYYLAVLILEDGIDGSSSSGNYTQNGVSNPESYKHDFVLRASATTGNVYGIKIGIDPTSGTEILQDYVVKINDNWANYYPVAILWKADGNASPIYRYINSVK